MTSADFWGGLTLQTSPGKDTVLPSHFPVSLFLAVELDAALFIIA
jgi:hypothetical protein